MISLHKRV